MGFKRTHKICVKTGSYTGSDGTTKNNWLECGYVLTNEADGAKMRCMYPYINIAGIPRDPAHDTVVMSEFPYHTEGEQGDRAVNATSYQSNNVDFH